MIKSDQFNQHLEKVSAAINARARRERALILVTGMVLMIMFWNGVIFGPLNAAKKKAEAEHQKMEESLQASKGKIKEVMQQMNIDPNTALKLREENAKKDLLAANSQLSDLTACLISPGEMSHVLQDVLKSVPNLMLNKLENQPPVRLVSPKEGDQQDIKLYKHGLVLEFSGQYFSTLFYLKMLEGLGVRFIWESLDYTVKEYPSATIKLVLRTLSKQEGLLGG